MAPSKQLRDRLAAASADPRRRVAFGVCQDSGWLRGSSAMVRLCAELWNARKRISAALRLADALDAYPEKYVKLEVAGCTCMTKTHLTEHHADTCVFAAAAALREAGSSA